MRRLFVCGARAVQARRSPLLRPFVTATLPRAAGPPPGAAVLDIDDFEEPPPPNRWRVEEYRGVWAEETAGPVVFEAMIDVNGKPVSGGEFESAEEAARAHDALAIMYGLEGAALNFERDTYSSWSPTDFQRYREDTHIEVKPGVRLTVEEVTGLLETERGVDIVSMSMAGKTDLADHMVWVTGRSVPHMRKLGRLLLRAARDRKVPGPKPEFEGRDMDDWMVVDCGDIIVNIMDAEAREVFDLETMYENMKEGVDPFDGYSYEEWLEANPVPDKWIRRLERDDTDDARVA